MHCVNYCIPTTFSIFYILSTNKYKLCAVISFPCTTFLKDGQIFYLKSFSVIILPFFMISKQIYTILGIKCLNFNKSNKSGNIFLNNIFG